MFDFYFVQFIGFIAFAISLLSYQFKSQKVMFGIRSFSDFIWACHYFLLSAPVVSITVLVASLRTFLVVFVAPSYKMLTIVCAIFVVFVVSLYSFYKFGDVYSFLPMLTAVIYGASTYFHESYRISRLLMGLGLLVWIVIGFINLSIPEVVSSSISLVSLITAYLRHKKLEI